MKPIEEFLLHTPRAALMPAPTPLHRLDRFFGETANPAYIKRDDMTGLGPGGNKIRSLEFILGEALDQGSDLILVAGPGQSNLCTLTAAACAKLGLDCELVLNAREPERKEGNLLLNQLLGAVTHFVGECTAEERARRVEERVQSSLREGRRPFVVRNGATTGRGALGYTAAAVELARQCREQGLESLTVFVPGGNGGVAAGLVYGNALIGQPFRVVVMSVEDEAPVLSRHIAETIREAEQLTGLSCPQQPDRLCQIVDEFRGEGWGANTRESAQAVQEFARQEGIFVENVYTSKVLVGMRAWLSRGLVPGPACFLHTGGFGSLFSQY